MRLANRMSLGIIVTRLHVWHTSSGPHPVIQKGIPVAAVPNVGRDQAVVYLSKYIYTERCGQSRLSDGGLAALAPSLPPSTAIDIALLEVE